MNLEFFNKFGSMLVSGTKVTIIVSLITIIISIIIGSILAMLRTGKTKVIRYIVSAYVAFVRGTPVLVQIYIVFYGIPLLGIEFPSFNIMGLDSQRVISGVLALAINSSAYVCEIIRSGIESLDKGQMEAARSLGFNHIQSMRMVILPQAIKNILPALGNEFIGLIKTSSLVSTIGLAELMYIADSIRGVSFMAFVPLFVVAVIYFVITFIVSLVIRALEQKMSKSN
ncbi:amino acid ABC transporter permease [Candidatus Clostridium helianthi]|uniref:Amino acid ABC transporter permease n=1 Tax=Candidatus Clostridium helianthi TaxID=3381660 RepID=A0ABW8SBE2_9CLOT